MAPEPVSVCTSFLQKHSKWHFVCTEGNAISYGLTVCHVIVGSKHNSQFTKSIKTYTNME